MNPPESTENQGDQISWVWDHSQQHHHHHHQSHNHNHPAAAVTMSIGLETRQFQGGGRVLEYDWGSTPVLLSGGQGIPQDTEERKPQMISAAGSVMDTIQYSGNGNGNVNLAVNGMLSSGFGHNIISPNSMGNLLMSSSAGTRNAYGGHNNHQHHHHHNNHHVLDSIRSSSPSSLLYSGGHSGLSGFGNGYNDSNRAALEEHRHHILGLMGMDQKNMFHNIVKREDLCAGDFQARIGLNLGLGGRTYFSSEDNIVNRLYKRPRAISPGSQVPRCQAEGCKADLSTAKHYHRRHKVCELHSKAATVVSGGLTQRFCQQCSRFHVLAEFDEGKRSCRKRLADHNRRRRKPQPNAVVTVSNTESSSALKNTDQDQDTNSGSNQSSLQQPEQISRSEAPGLLTGISLSQSLPLVLQTSKGQEQYLQQTGPNLSLGGEIALDYPRHSTGGENYSGLEIPIPWLRPAGSGSEFGGSEKNSSNGQVSESGGGGSSSTVQVFTSIQNLLPLPLQSSTELGNSDWMVNGNLSGSSSRGQHYGPADLNLHSSLEGQQMLSLLEKDVRSSNVDTDRHNTEDAVEYFSQQQGLSSKHSVDGHSEHRNQLSTSFSGIQSLRSLSQSMYQNIL